jgi:hypothetical protein
MSFLIGAAGAALAVPTNDATSPSISNPKRQKRIGVGQKLLLWSFTLLSLRAEIALGGISD